jgi:hypothetical protein
MPEIRFRGKTYRSESEMPLEVRQAYNREQNNTVSKPLSDVVDMSPEVKAIYERALGKVETNVPASRRSAELPNTEEIYRQSAPSDMKHLPSDESIYRPSQPLIDPAKSVIEPESAFGMNRFVASVVWALILALIGYLIVQFLL